MRRRTTTLAMLAVLAISLGCPFGNNPGTPAPPVPPTQDVLDKETATFNQVNAERTSRSISALTLHSGLRDVARAHSQDMVNRNFFDHTNPNGQSPGDRVTAAGIGWTSVAENIAWNNYPDPVTTAVTGWMGSTGHRANILDNTFTHSAVGIADAGSGKYYFTQLFMVPSKSGAQGCEIWSIEGPHPAPLAIPEE